MYCTDGHTDTRCISVRFSIPVQKYTHDAHELVTGDLFLTDG